MLGGKRGLVTGGGAGLGRETCLLAAREGSRVGVLDIDGEAAEKTASDIREAGGEAVACEVDVADGPAMEEAVSRVVESFGGLDWASNNAAGGMGGFSLVHEIDDRTWNRTIDVCLKGVFHGIKYEVPAMLASGGGSIINIGSASQFKGEAFLGAYVAAKGGVDALTKTAAAEYSAQGVRVNSVAPGGFETAGLARYFEKFPEFEAQTVAQHAMRRVGKPGEVAEAVIWLASERSSFVTGACLQCDGGVLVNSHLL